MPDRTPLDRLVIDANAIDVAVRNDRPLNRVHIWAEKAWDAMPEKTRHDLRDLYRPVYDRVAAAVLRAEADSIDTMHAGPAGAPYVSATKALLRDRATAYENGVAPK